MREIKFRVWDKKDKVMVSWDEINKSNSIFIWIRGNNRSGGLANDMYQLMQYTGLKDRNGREIYEGDVLECGDWVDDAHAWNTWEQEVVFEDGGFTVYSNGNGCYMEVIRNIYENEELLS